MRKIAVIGDSHTAMLKQALENIDLQPNSLNVDFFVWRSNGKNELIVQGIKEYCFHEIKILKDEDHIINLEEYSAVVICGLGFELRRLMDLYKKFSVFDKKGCGNVISKNLYFESAKEILSNSVASKLTEALIKITKKDIFFVPVPRLSESHMENVQSNDAFHICIENGDCRMVSELFDSVANIFRDKGVVVVEQPNKTISKSIFTKVEYTRSVNPEFDKAYRDKRGKSDNIHMNGKYGLLIMNKILNMMTL